MESDEESEVVLLDVIRWILKYAKVNFEDERIEFSDWPNQKSKYPLQQVPVLQEDGKVLTQSGAIALYLGKKFGLTTGDPWLDFLVDSVTRIVEDGRTLRKKYQMEKDEKLKEEYKQEVLTTSFPRLLKQLNDIVDGQGGPFIAGTKVTYGDFVLGHWLQIWGESLPPKTLESYPALFRLLEAVVTLPEIKEWIATRPKTDF